MSTPHLPRDYEEIVKLPNGELWRFFDEHKSPTYKVYTQNAEVARILKSANGVRTGAWGYPGQGFDFIVKSFAAKDVLKLLSRPAVAS